jgi:hypothetical protein
MTKEEADELKTQLSMIAVECCPECGAADGHQCEGCDDCGITTYERVYNPHERTSWGFFKPNSPILKLLNPYHPIAFPNNPALIRGYSSWPVCANCGKPVPDDDGPDIIGDGTNRGSCCVGHQSEE